MKGFEPLFRILADPIEALLAVKGCDADTIREELVKAVITAKSNHCIPIPHDQQNYRWPNLVERLFNKQNNWCRVENRYDKIADSYLGFVKTLSVAL